MLQYPSVPLNFETEGPGGACEAITAIFQSTLTSEDLWVSASSRTVWHFQSPSASQLLPIPSDHWFQPRMHIRSRSRVAGVLLSTPARTLPHGRGRKVAGFRRKPQSWADGFVVYWIWEGAFADIADAVILAKRKPHHRPASGMMYGCQDWLSAAFGTELFRSTRERREGRICETMAGRWLRWRWRIACC